MLAEAPADAVSAEETATELARIVAEERQCHCGATHGAFELIADGRWQCLGHRPRVGAIVDRRLGSRVAS